MQGVWQTNKYTNRGHNKFIDIYKCLIDNKEKINKLQGQQLKGQIEQGRSQNLRNTEVMGQTPTNALLLPSEN